MVDLGSGTGIIPIVVSECGGFRGKIHAIDYLDNCIESTKMNCQIFGLADKINPVQLDLMDIYSAKPATFADNQIEFYKKVTSELGLPMQVDLITCNPPWIPCEFIADSSPLDNGVYDPKEAFLEAALNFAKLHLSSKGEMILVYSDLAYLLGL